MDGAAKVKVAEGAVSSSFPSSSPPKIAPSLLEGNDGVSDAESANAEDGAGYGGPGSGEWGPEFQFRSSLVRIRAPVTEIDDAEGDEEEEEEDDDDASGASYDTALERMAAASTLSSLYGSPRGTPTGSLFGSEAGERDSLRRRLREVMPASESGWPDPGEEYGNGNGGEGQLIPVAKLTADDELLEYGEQSGLVSGASGYLYSDEEEEYGEEVTSGLRPSAAGLHVAGAAQLAAPEKGAGVEDSPDDADFTADGERPLPPAAHGAGPGDGSLSEPAAPAPVVPAAKADDSQELSSPALPAQGYPVAVGQEQAEPQGLGASEGLGDGIAVAGELEAVSDQVLPAAGAGDAESDALPAVEGIAEGKEAVSFAGSSAVEGQGTEQDTAQLEKRVLEPDETAAGVTTEDAHSFTSSAGVDVSEVRAPEPTAAEGAPLAEASQQATDVVESEPAAVDGLPIARASEDDDHSSGYTAEAAVTYESREPEPATAEGLPIARGDTAAGVTTEDAHSSTSSAGIGVSEVRAPEPTAAEGAPLAEASQQATDVVESEPGAVDGLPIARASEDDDHSSGYTAEAAVTYESREPEPATAEGLPIARGDTAAGVTTEDAHSSTSSAGIGVSEVRAPEPTAAEGAPLAEASQQATDVVESEPGAVEGLPIARASEDDDDSSGYTAVAAVTYESREPEPATAEGLPIARGDTAAGVTTEDAHSSTSSAGIGVSEVRAPEPTAAEGAPLAEASQQATDVVESEPRAVERLPIARASEDDDDSSGYTAVAAVTYESREPEPATAEGLPIARGLNDDVSDSQIADVPELEPATATVEVDGPIGSQGQTGQVHEPATAEGFPVAGASYPDPEAAEGLQIARVTEDEAGTPTFPPPLGDVSGKDQEALAPPEAATAAGVVPFARVTSEDADSSTHTSVTEDVPSERGLHVAKVTEEADVAAFSPVPGYVSPEPATATGLPVAGVTEETDNPPESTARGLPIARLTEDADIPSSTSVAEYVPIARVTDTPTSSSVIGDGTPESDVGEGRPIGDAKTTAPTDNFPETAPLPLESAASKGVDATDGELDQDEAPKPSKDNGVILDQAPLQATKPLSESGDPGAQDDEHEKQQPETVVTTPSDSKDIDSNSVVKSVLEYAAAAKLEDSAQKHVSDKELQQDTVTIVQVGGSKHRNLAQLLHSEAEVAAEEAPAGSETEPAAKQAKSKVKIFQVAKEFGKTTRSKGARFAKTTLKVLHFRNVNCFSPRKPLPVVSKEDDLDKPRASLAK